jgi:hypothetical protein
VLVRQPPSRLLRVGTEVVAVHDPHRTSVMTPFCICADAV